MKHPSLLVAALAIFCLLSPMSHASRAPSMPTPLESVFYAPDITISLNGVEVPGGNLVQEVIDSASVNVVSSYAPPAGTRIITYHRVPSGGVVLSQTVSMDSELFAFDTPVALGSFTARPGDVVLRSGSGSFTLLFDAAANGIPLQSSAGRSGQNVFIPHHSHPVGKLYQERG